MRRLSSSRRTFLQASSILLAGVAAACRSRQPPAPVPQAAVPAPAAPPVFSDLQRRTLDAASARILPTDQDPGAREAGVIDYLEHELAKTEMAELRTGVLAGVVALNRVAAKQGGKTFAELPAAEQDEVLRQLQQGSQRGADFVGLLVALTLEGYLGDPRYGGNKGLVGWKLAGYSPIDPHHHHG